MRRLTGTMHERVWKILSIREWMTLAEISAEVGYGEASVSANIRLQRQLLPEGLDIVLLWDSDEAKFLYKLVGGKNGQIYN